MRQRIPPRPAQYAFAIPPGAEDVGRVTGADKYAIFGYPGSGN
jgi:hypothetical protein